MLTAMIVDDEIWVAQLINCSIDWTLLEIEVIALAQDGVEGYENICKLQPDIVITDVRMPIMDGISLIEATRNNKELKKQPDFIIISGYQDFEYAQKALKYGVSNYILKPFNENELMTTLKNIHDKIVNNIAKANDDQSVRHLLSESLNKLREKGLMDFFNRKSSFKNIEEFNNEFTFNFELKSFNVVYIKVDNINCSSPLSQQLLTYVSDHFLAYLNCTDISITFSYIEENAVVTLINYSSHMKERIMESIKHAFFALLYDKSINRQVQISLGYSRSSFSFSDLPDAYEHSRSSADCKILYGSNRIYDISQLELNYIPIQDLLKDKVKEKINLTHAIESFNKDEISRSINALYSTLINEKAVDPRSLYELGDAIIDIYDSIISKMEIPSDKLISAAEIHSLLDSCKNVNEFPAKLVTGLSEAITSYREIKKNSPIKPIQVAQSYIAKHYSEQILLNDVAGEVFLNPQYFSELFKNEVGMNFSDYLANYRIEAAKKLLTMPGEKIKDVCLKVGYTDSKSFSKLFKKHVGLTPKEYCKLYC